MDSTRSTHAAVTLVLVATVGLAFKGILARFAYATGLSVTGLLVLRAAFATPLLWLVGWLWRGQFASVSHLDLLRACGCGVMFLASATLDFMAIEGLGAGPSRLILFAYPLLVIVLEAVRAGRAPSRRELWAFAAAWAGLLVVSSDSWQHGAPLTAVLCGVGAAIVHAVYLTLTQALARRMGSVPFTAASNTGTAIGIFAYVALGAHASELQFTRAGVLWLVVLAVFCTALPLLGMVEGVRRIGASRASLLSLSGPVVTLVGAWLLLGEPLTGRKLLGAALVIGAVGWHVRARSSSSSTRQLGSLPPEPAALRR